MRASFRLTLLALALARSGVAQAPRPAQPAAPDTAAARALAASYRAAWLSDRLPLRTGDVLTVVVDEQTAARERVSQVATGQRSQQADLNAGLATGTAVGPVKGFATGMDARSRDVGEANHQGDLTAVLSVRVTAIEPNGVARIRGTRQVTVDGRRQDITLDGVVRPEDISSSNTVLSGSIAEAVISYRGKKIGPRTGILGKILAILWP
jgi:flagellar L-ring protein precursor FlgH